MEYVKNIAAIIGLVLSAIALISACTRGGRSAIKRIFSKNTSTIVDHIDEQEERISTLTNEIDSIGEKLDRLNCRLGKLEKLCENLDSFNGVVAVSMQQCRNIIKNIYYKYYKTGHIPMYERKTADATFQIYSDELKGNSYAQLLYKEICKLEIDPSDIKEDDA